ncbi:hypothetical protein DFH09DRAFT_1136366 [Mycena vulgaris]|nr:hypothetical protein DFH09DRAFT_1136366 [Mycena vulgaris]
MGRMEALLVLVSSLQLIFPAYLPTPTTTGAVAQRGSRSDRFPRPYAESGESNIRVMESPCWNCGESLTAAPRPALVPLESTRLLTTNDVPLSSELPTIHRLLSDGRDLLDLLDTELAELRMTTERRRIRERDEAAECARQYTAVVSVVRRVPSELICGIFASTAPSTRRIGKCVFEQPPWRCSCWSRARRSGPISGCV